MDVDRTRTSGIFNAGLWSLGVIGLGGIGSNLGLVAGKMGFTPIHIFDMDTVSPENTATQLYSPMDIDYGKAFVMDARMQVFSPDVEIISHCRQVAPGMAWPQVNLVVSCVDSIRSRKMIWETIRNQEWFAYLDVRMGPEAAQVWCVDKRSASRYAGFLERQDDSLVPDDPCTSKATFYGGALAASLAAYLLRRIITGQKTRLYYEFDLKSFSALSSG